MFSHHGGVASTPTIDEVIEMKRIHDMCSSEHFFMGITWRQGCEPHAGLQFYRWRSDRGDVEPNLRQHDALDFILMHKAVEKEYRLEICFKGAPLRQEKNLSQASQAVVSSESLGSRNPSLKLAKASDIYTFLQKLSLARQTKSLVVSSWIQDAPVAAGVRTLKDAHRHIREELETLAKSQRVHIRKKKRGAMGCN